MKGILVTIETDIKNTILNESFLELIPNVEKQYIAFSELPSKRTLQEVVTLLTIPYKRFCDLLIINGVNQDRAIEKTISAFRNIYTCTVETQNAPNRHRMTGVYFEVVKDLNNDEL